MSSASAIQVVRLVCLGIGLILHIIGLATPEWSEGGRMNFGLFRYCVGDNCADMEEDSKVDATKAMAIIGALMAVAGLVLGIYLLVAAYKEKTIRATMPKVTAAINIAAFIFILLGVIIWAAAIHDDYEDKLDADLGYSFALSIVGGILTLAGGIMFCF